MNSLYIADINKKLKACDESIELAFQSVVMVPENPGRDIQVLLPQFHPNKKGLSTIEGQARLLHDLASIELQAFELALRTLFEYQDAPVQFRDELAALTRSEAKHLQLCLDGLEALGYKWGDWPVHLSLWQAVSKSDSILDRILIVHRYLEGSGLDAGNQLLRRLNGVSAAITEPILRTINTEELDHVVFGSKWYRAIAKDQSLDPDIDFPLRLAKLRASLPKRIEKINPELRIKAGFTESEIIHLQNLRDSFFGSHPG